MKNSHAQSPQSSSRVAANSLKAIRDQLKRYASMLAEQGKEGPFREFNLSNLVNAITAWFLAQPDEMRAVIASEGTRLYGLALEHDRGDKIDFQALLRPDGKTQYAGETPSRLKVKKSRSANEAIG